MTTLPMNRVLQHIHRLLEVQTTGEQSDRQLLDRFARQRDEAAFAALVRRHGGLVLGVCRRVLHNLHDAEDAFQATFLVLARKADSVRWQESVGSWLYTVAHHIAVKARVKSDRRQLRETQVIDMPQANTYPEVPSWELQPILDEELSRLPEKYRAPLVLCYLEGKTKEEAARQLGCTQGAVKGKLERARDLLRGRLTQRGLALSTTALVMALTENVGSAAVPATLIETTARAAVLFTTHSTITAGVSASAAVLAEGALQTMWITKTRFALAMLLTVGLLGTGFGWFSLQALADKPADDAKPQAAPVLIRSAQSGPWSVPATWEGGKVPPAGAKVQVREGHTVVYDLKSDQAIRSLHLGGILTFAPDKDTRLDVGLIKIQPGDDTREEGFDCESHPPEIDPSKPRPALEVGTPHRPIDAKHTALIRLVPFAGLDPQSCPAIVCCAGRMDFHGTPMNRTWVKLGETANAGDTTLTLAEPVTGWKIGDRLIVTATSHHGRKVTRRGPQTEERTIKAIDGTKLTIDQPLEIEHLGTGDYRGEVANLSRNVVVESGNPTEGRGHTMYHRGSAGAISYAEFRHLGKEGVLGRYSLHFHLAGDTMRGSYVQGASIWDSGNRWLTIHGTNYLVVRDCVGYKSVGHGYFLEDGTEVYNVLDRNLAVHAMHTKKLPKQALPFDQNDGAGFWWANSLNTFTRNVAAENDRYGYRYEATPTSALKLVFPIQQPDGSRTPVDIRTLPFVRFEDNEVHSGLGLYGFNLGEGVNRVGPDTKHPFIVRNTKIWDQHYAFRPQVPSLLVDHMKIHQAGYGVYHPNYENHVYRDLLISHTNTEPFNRGHDDLSVQYGSLTVDGLTFQGIYSGRSMPLIQISDDNPTGTAVSHFRNVKTVDWVGTKDRALVNLGGGPRPTPKTEKGVPVILHDWFGPGRHARVVSTKTKELREDGFSYKEEPLLTGDESRVAEVREVEFPTLLQPVDDLPPVTVITHIGKPESGTLVVRGTTSDNGPVAKVLVNGREAKALAPNFAEWEVVLTDVKPGDVKLTAHAEDAAGNVEKRPHSMSVRLMR